MKVSTYAAAVALALAAIGDELTARGDVPAVAGAEDDRAFAIYMQEREEPEFGGFTLDGGQVVLVDKDTGHVWQSPTWYEAGRLARMRPTA